MKLNKLLIGGLGLIALISLSNGCAALRPIKVGFTGELTGKHADLGVHGRNGTLLAVEEINAAGGIAGRPIKLLIRDDQGSPKDALAADIALIEAGVVAIVGHMTSENCIAVLPLIEETETILLSPTASTPALSGLDDHFFRVNPDNALEVQRLAQRIYHERQLTRVAGIYDADNEAYSQTFWSSFATAYDSMGGQIVGDVRFASTEEPDFASLMTELEMRKPDALLIIASAIDTALISQQTRLRGWHIPLFASGWAQTETLIQNGGHAVEGIEIVMNYDANSQDPYFLEFQSDYRERFGYPPTFAAAQAYEALLVLATALDKTNGRSHGLRQALLETQGFKGLTGTISIDQYGDTVRTQFLITVRNGQFETMKSFEQEGP